MANALLINSAEHLPVCRLCGQKAKLSFEHIPPKRCFNNKGVLAYTIESMTKRLRSGKKMNRGMGAAALCETCNQTTGRLYGNAYAELVERAMSYWQHGPDTPMHVLPFHVDALAASKQILTMVIAANDAQMMESETFAFMRWLVRSPKLNLCPPNVRLFAYYADLGEPRLCKFNAHVWQHGQTNVMVWAEIALPPLGIVATSGDIQCRRLAASFGMADITHFLGATFNSRSTYMLRMNRLSPIGAASFDYEGFAAEPFYPSR